MVKNWLIVIALSIFNELAGQDTQPARPSPFLFRNTTINEGLSQNSVIDIAFDGKGCGWLATQDGLNRYDGTGIEVFKYTFDDITTSTQSRIGKLFYHSNELWMITSGGRLGKLDLLTYGYTLVSYLGNPRTPIENITCFLKDSHNNYWIGTADKGLLHYNSTTQVLKRYEANPDDASALPGNSIQSVYEDRKKQVWVLTNLGVTVFDAAMKTRHYLSDASSPETCGAIAEDAEGNIWLGSYGNGIFLKPANGEAFTRFTGYDKLALLPGDLKIETLHADRSGRIWAGTFGKGLFVIQPRTKNIYQLTLDRKNPRSIAFDDVLCIREDRWGGIWIGTDGGGLSYYDERLNNFSSFTSANLPEKVSIDLVRAITRDSKGRVWAGTSSNGLTYIDSLAADYGTIHFAPFKPNISNNDRVVSLLADDDDDIWTGTQGNGLLIVDAETKKIKNRFHSEASGMQKIPDHTIWCMLPEAGGLVWAGTGNGGLCLLDKKKGVIKHFSFSASDRNNIADNNIRCLARINDSTIVIGFEKKGIQFLHTNSDSFYSIRPRLADAIWETETTIKCFYYQHPILWIGTAGRGLASFNLETRDLLHITEKDGLANNTAYAILPDSRGSLWISSNRGLSRFTPSRQDGKLAVGSFVSYTAEDGLQSNEFNTGAWYRSPSGRLYFGGIKGINYFYPERFAATQPNIPVIITQVAIDNEPLKSDTNVIHKKMLRLSPTNNSIAFTFSVLDFAATGRYVYYHQLVGYDKDWINTETRNYAAYTNLSPGEYEFRVMAAAGEITGNESVSTISIVIPPPFWRTWWFIALCVLAIGGIIYAFFRYRINQLIALQRVRNRIATDLHDDIGSSLTNINILSELSRNNIDEPLKAKGFITRIGEEVSHSSQALDDIVWSINTQNDSLEQMAIRMRRYAAELFDGANIIYFLRMEDQFADRKLNMEQRRDFFLVFKELVNNIFKHAGAKKVEMEIWVAKNQLHLTLVDDGKGFDPEATTHRNGLKNIRQRVQKWKGKVNFQSAPGKGARTEVVMPVV